MFGGNKFQNDEKKTNFISKFYEKLSLLKFYYFILNFIYLEKLINVLKINNILS